MTDHSPYTVPKEPGRWRAITLAAAVHVALLVFFWIGIDWQSETPVAVKAEIWDMQAKEAAPLPPEPEPTPQPKPEPKPIVKETPKAEPIKPEPPKVDIALEKEKKRKEQERKDKLAEEEKEKKLKQKAEQDKQEKLDKQAADKKSEQQQKKAEADKKRLQDQRDAELRDKIRAEEMRRLTGGAVGSGGSGQAAKSQSSGRADGAYADKIRAKIRSNTVFNVPADLNGNPQVEYDVELLPDGSLRGLRLRKSSGLPAFDEAVKRAIERSQPFPPDQSGSVPSRLTVVHKPKDQ